MVAQRNAQGPLFKEQLQQGVIMKLLLWNLYRFFGRLSEKSGDWAMDMIHVLDRLDPHYAGRKWAKQWQSEREVSNGCGDPW